MQDQSFVDQLSLEIAERRGWPREWLNDGVRVYLSPKIDGVQTHHEFFRGYPSEHEPGLRVFIPTPEYILAMKLMAMRLDPAAGEGDLSDILNLMQVVGLETEEAIITFAAGFYPEARISGRLRLGIAELWRFNKSQRREEMQPRPSTLAEVARRRHAGEDFSLLLREFLDEFYAGLPTGDAARLIADPPQALPDAEEHAFLGRAGEHLARRWGLPVPAWTDDPTRLLRRPFFTTPLEGLKALLIAESPVAFRRRLIFTEAEPLRRARMPRAAVHRASIPS